MTLNLADYVGREDEIEHCRGQEIQAIVHCPNTIGNFSKIVVVFKDASCGTYATSGHSYASSAVFFKLKPKKHAVDFWINLYHPNSSTGNPYSYHYGTKKQALSSKDFGCIATINIKRTIIEGEIDE